MSDNHNDIESLFITEEPNEPEESPTSEQGTTFSISFADGQTIEIRGESFYMVALVKAVNQYMEQNPEFKMSDLTMTDLKYWNGERVEYILKDTRFCLGIH